MNRILKNVVLLAAFGAMSSPALAVVDGSFDPTWAGAGRIAFAGEQLKPYFPSEAHRIIVEGNGNLLLGGNVNGQNDAGQPFHYWWLGELFSSGAGVYTFGQSDGSAKVTSCYLSAYLCAHSQTDSFGAMALQADGRIAVMEGNILSRTTASAHSLDTTGTAGGNGYISATDSLLINPINNVGGSFRYPKALAQTSLGKWLVAGGGFYTGVSSNTVFAVIQLNADLSLDRTFNATTTDANGVTNSGAQTVGFNVSGSSSASSVTLQDDGRIVLVGVAQSVPAVARLNGDGTLDTTFGALDALSGMQSGTIILNWSSGSLNWALLAPPAVKIDRAGRILIAMPGLLTGQNHYGMAVVRLLPNGTPDTSFGPEGVSLPAPSNICPDGSFATALALDSAGRILVAGRCQATAQYFFLERLHGDDGSLDTTFGIAGTSHGGFAALSTNDSIDDVVFDASGRPVIVGYTTPSITQQVGVARLTYDLIFTNNLETVPRGRLPGQ